MTPLGIRWTIGDVSERGYEALRLSIWGAFQVFGPEAAYVVCINGVPADEGRRRVGRMPVQVEWWQVDEQVPGFLRERFDAGMAEGVGWKLAPLRCFPDRKELSLDNDCILWSMPRAIGEWLDSDDERVCVVAEDVAAALGQFADLCDCGPRNLGIRGLPPGFDLESAMRAILDERPGAVLSSELDEQGLQTAALYRSGMPLVVRVEEVSICSPFKPHLTCLGSCGAHFVGLNARRLPWEWEGRNASEYIAAHWDSLVGEVAERVGAVVKA